MPEFSGNSQGGGLRFAIVASRYNDFITGRLVEGARQYLMENGVADRDIDVFWCPGALEIPGLGARIARQGANGRRYHGLVTVGCVIKGDTDHYTFVAGECMRGISQIALEGHLAVGNAVLTVFSADQAIARSGEKTMNKGWEAASAALEMATLYRNTAQPDDEVVLP
jgi:6,7-dimethyl-8-ribityllumazine synthase